MKTGILSTVGQTPLVRLENLSCDLGLQVYAKLEMLNPGGSIKDRPALNMISCAIEDGLIGKHTTVIESSSGNLGVGLAQVCAALNLPFICVVDPRTVEQNIQIMKAYGADVECILAPDPLTGDLLTARINRVQALLGSIEDSFWCNQYANLNNARSHHHTMCEILSSLDAEVDYLVCSTSTCGTLRGCSDYLRSHDLSTKVIAVDAVGSVIFGGPKGDRLIPGHGAGRVPELFRQDLYDHVVQVTDIDCIEGCYRLLRREAIFAGGSSGGIVAALEKTRSKLPDGATCVVVLCDRGERYLSTIYSEDWVKEHFGNEKDSPPTYCATSS